jgi:hypothetical protein
MQCDEHIIIHPMAFVPKLRCVFMFILCVVLLNSSVVLPGDKISLIRAFTRNIEFDYVAWIANASLVKLNQSIFAPNDYISPENQQYLVHLYIDLISKIQQSESKVIEAYSDPSQMLSEMAIMEMQTNLRDLEQKSKRLDPIVESILQNQLSTIVGANNLSLGGQPIPPILYHSTPIPTALIISPREIIQQEANISLQPYLKLVDQIHLEKNVESALNVSALVVEIGGVGVYPTMVMETTDLKWLAEVVAHEWTHNYLSLRPLGINYLTSPELRTMNETTAAIAGKELGEALIKQFYPELMPVDLVDAIDPNLENENTLLPPPFDFRAEMHFTRITVDKLLKEGKVLEAEQFMENQRNKFWDNGYLIRRLNQAYFAFHGAYADEPAGPAGKDIVGEAVRAYRSRSPSLAFFIKHISWMWTFDQLKNAVSDDLSSE